MVSPFIFIGASGDDDRGIDSGSAYVFVKPFGTAWTATSTAAAKLTADDGAAGDSFGYSVGVDGDTTAVGAYQDDDNGGDSGAAYVFTRNSGVWDNGVKLTADDGEVGDNFGFSVAVDVDAVMVDDTVVEVATVVVGAYQHDPIDPDSLSYLLDAGAAYVFTKDPNGDWIETNKLTDDDGAPGDWFGYAVAVDSAAHTALVGAGSAHVLDIHDWEEIPHSGATTTSHMVTDLTNSLTYRFQVRAVNLASEGPHADAEATPRVNVPPVARNDAVTTAEDTAIVIRVLGNDTDADGDTLSVTAVSTPSNGAAAITGNRTTVNYTPDASFHGSDSFTYVVSDGNGGTDTGRVNVTVTAVDDEPANRSPRFNEGATTTRTVPENAAIGTAVGEPVSATDEALDTLHYSVLVTGQKYFSVDVETGQITTAAPLDYETQSQYAVQLRVRDGQGGSDGINVTITVEDVDEPPSQPGAPEVSSTGTTGLTVSWTAPDNQGPEITDYDARYREAGVDFQDAGYSGIGTSVTLKDLRPGTGYEVQVRAINAEGPSPWSESGRGETKHVPPPPTPTPNPTPEPTATATPTPEPTATATPTPEPTATATPTPEPTATATPTPEPTATATPTPEPTATATPTPEPTATATPTPEPTATATPTPEPTATATPTLEPTATATPTPEPTTTPTAPPLAAPAPTSTLSQLPTSAPIATATPAVTPERRESDSEGGLPWWVILLLSLGGVGVVLLAWVRRRRRQG